MARLLLVILIIKKKIDNLLFYFYQDTSFIWCTSDKGLQIRRINQATDLINTTISPQPHETFGVLEMVSFLKFKSYFSKNYKYFIKI